MAYSGLGVLEHSEVLFDVGQRSQEALLFGVPERDADGAARLLPERLDEPRSLHHHGGADGIIGGPGGGVPGIQVPAEHHDFVGLVGAGDFGHHVVGGLALGVDVVDDVELQAHVLAVVEQALDAAVIFVAEDHRGDRLGDVVGAVVEGADLAVFARGVVDAHAARRWPPARRPPSH